MDLPVNIKKLYQIGGTELTLSATITWLSRLNDGPKGKDFLMCQLYTYQWDVHLNAMIRSKPLPDDDDEYVGFLETTVAYLTNDPAVKTGWHVTFGAYRSTMVLHDSGFQGVIQRKLAIESLFAAANVTVDELTPEVVRTILLPVLADRMRAAAIWFGGIPMTCTLYRTILIPKDSTFVSAKTIDDYMSTSLSPSSSLCLFGISEAFVEDGVKIVFCQIEVDVGTPVIPLFLSGCNAAAEQEVLLMPGFGTTMTQIGDTINVDDQEALLAEVRRLSLVDVSLVSPNAGGHVPIEIVKLRVSPAAK